MQRQRVVSGESGEINSLGQHQIDLVVGQDSAELDLTLSQVCHPRKKQREEKGNEQFDAASIEQEKSTSHKGKEGLGQLEQQDTSSACADVVEPVNQKSSHKIASDISKITYPENQRSLGGCVVQNSNQIDHTKRLKKQMPTQHMRSQHQKIARNRKKLPEFAPGDGGDTSLLG